MSFYHLCVFRGKPFRMFPWCLLKNKRRTSPTSLYSKRWNSPCIFQLVASLGLKKILVVPVPHRPYSFLPTLLFFQCDWLCDPIFSGWLRAAHTACQNGVYCHTNYWTKLPKFVHRKYTSLVDIDVGTLLQIAQQKTRQNHEKNSSKKNLFPAYWP